MLHPAPLLYVAYTSLCVLIFGTWSLLASIFPQTGSHKVWRQPWLAWTQVILLLLLSEVTENHTQLCIFLVTASKVFHFPKHSLSSCKAFTKCSFLNLPPFWSSIPCIAASLQFSTSMPFTQGNFHSYSPRGDVYINLRLASYFQSIIYLRSSGMSGT